jgi:hypothetical protein
VAVTTISSMELPAVVAAVVAALVAALVAAVGAASPAIRFEPSGAAYAAPTVGPTAAAEKHNAAKKLIAVSPLQQRPGFDQWRRWQGAC